MTTAEDTAVEDDPIAERLNERLIELQVSAGGFGRWKRSRDEGLRQLCEILLWELEASKIEGYLNGLFEKHGIKYRRTTGRPNFSAAVRLVFRLFGKLSSSDYVLVSQRAKALLALWTELERDPEQYAHNTVGQLFRFGELNGYIVGLAVLVKDDEDTQPDLGPDPNPDPEPDPEPDPDPNGSPPPDPDDPDGELDIDAIVAEFATAAGGSETIDPETVRTNPAGLTVLLASKRGGRLVFHGSSDADESIDAVAGSIATHDRPFLAPILRAIVETQECVARPYASLPTDRVKRDEWLKRDYGVLNKAKRVRR